MTDMTTDNIHLVWIEDTGSVSALFTFAEYDDAQAFQAAVNARGSESRVAHYDEQLVLSGEQAQQTINDELSDEI